MPIEQAGGVVVRRDHGSVRYLLVTAKSDARRWIFPKGHVERGESAEDAAVREVREEAGVVGRIRTSLGAMHFRFEGEDWRVHFFLMDHVEDVGTDEKRRLAWLAFEDAHERLTWQETREILSRARQAAETGG